MKVGPFQRPRINARNLVNHLILLAGIVIREVCLQFPFQAQAQEGSNSLAHAREVVLAYRATLSATAGANATVYRDRGWAWCRAAAFRRRGREGLSVD
jgi:hypothetical protein